MKRLIRDFESDINIIDSEIQQNKENPNFNFDNFTNSVIRLLRDMNETLKSVQKDLGYK